MFHIMKNILGYKKVRYKGIEKNFAQQNLLLALANLYMLGKSDLLKNRGSLTKGVVCPNLRKIQHSFNNSLIKNGFSSFFDLTSYYDEKR